ncbi:hypothetical protein HOU79_gp04 [Vibrio phage 1.224.A._10N.261.48.B1]|uniref:Uncharacterized protein n=1 Tax=Vibrio phage 1.224.A._10N.261.48.B1 TaxID=1881226 RepID=A0A2I7RRU1_9CAUD|nr:hypothetical protein HOU79_gp04 [Vibrio phage 1.224.A._10N.261.48.B1]AUR96371.1 hypothetical protein NVP1224A_04 [Vibrio phage 1.224.A._10N.261.48.B1]
MTNRHPNADMLIAKVENMDLVLFSQALPYINPDIVPSAQDIKLIWVVHDRAVLPIDSKSTYFLCLPQHKEVCLHWLNGGEVGYFHGKRWHTLTSHIAWEITHIFMYESFPLQIKPKDN